MSSWVPTAPLSGRNVPLWSSIHREGELPPVATLEGVRGSPRGWSSSFARCCGLGIAGNSQGAAGWLKGPQPPRLEILRPSGSRGAHGATPLVHPPFPGKAEDSTQGQVEPLQGWDSGDSHPKELSSGCTRHGLSSSASPGDPKLHFPEGLGQPEQEQGPRGREGTRVPRLARKKLSGGWGPVAAHAGGDRQLQQRMEGSERSHPLGGIGQRPGGPRRAQCPCPGRHHLGK